MSIAIFDLYSLATYLKLLLYLYYNIFETIKI